VSLQGTVYAAVMRGSSFGLRYNLRG